MNEIINKVSNSGLMTLDLEDYYPSENRVQFDIKEFLFKEIFLKEKDFREKLKNHDWELYNNTYVAMVCSSDAILPSWAFMLITSYLQPYAKLIVLGDLKFLESSIYTRIIENIEVKEFENKKVIIKGCSNKPIPENAYIQLITKLKPVVSSLMFGEACSTVPLYKKPK